MVEETLITDSILTSIKKLLGPSEEVTHFDPDIIIHINSALFTLSQIGVGPKSGFFITDKTDTWMDFLPDINRLEGVKQFVFLSTKLVFDPPGSSAAVQSMENKIKELTFYLNAEGDNT